MFDTFLAIGAWLGFALFVVCFFVGAFVTYQAITLAITIAFARWKWRKVRQMSQTPEYAWEIARLMKKEMDEEEAKEKSTHTHNKPNATTKEALRRSRTS